MAELMVGVDGVIAVEHNKHCIDGWEYATTHTYYSEMIMWCKNRGLEYGNDYALQTYRLEGRDQNSHRWYFKDPEVATLFSLIFS